MPNGVGTMARMKIVLHYKHKHLRALSCDAKSVGNEDWNDPEKNHPTVFFPFLSPQTRFIPFLLPSRQTAADFAIACVQATTPHHEGLAIGFTAQDLGTWEWPRECSSICLRCVFPLFVLKGIDFTTGHVFSAGRKCKWRFRADEHI